MLHQRQERRRILGPRRETGLGLALPSGELLHARGRFGGRGFGLAQPRRRADPLAREPPFFERGSLGAPLGFLLGRELGRAGPFGLVHLTPGGVGSRLLAKRGPLRTRAGAWREEEG